MTYLKKLDIKLIDGEYENPVCGQVRFPEQVYEVFKNIKDNSRETLIGVYLTPELEVRNYDVITVGGRDVSLAIPHEIFERVLLSRSRYFILIHNHPDGDPKPSKSDKKVMQAIRKGANILQLQFLDFIIVGDLKKKKSYWSMFEGMEGGEYGLGAMCR